MSITLLNRRESHILEHTTDQSPGQSVGHRDDHTELRNTLSLSDSLEVAARTKLADARLPLSRSTNFCVQDRTRAPIRGPKIVRLVPVTDHPTTTTPTTVPAAAATSVRTVVEVAASRPTLRTNALPGAEVQLHASADRFEAHIEKHIATSEVLRALTFAHPDLHQQQLGSAGLVSPRDIVRAVRRGPHHQDYTALETFYRVLATRTLDEAHAIGWVIRPNSRVLVALSPTGFLAVVDGGILRTLFVPGIASDESRLEAAGHAGMELHAQRRREAAWPADTRHYHTVFRPAIQLVRSLPVDAIAGECSQYGALKRVLPGASSLRFDGWALALSQARRGATIAPTEEDRMMPDAR